MNSYILNNHQKAKMNQVFNRSYWLIDDNKDDIVNMRGLIVEGNIDIEGFNRWWWIS